VRNTAKAPAGLPAILSESDPYGGQLCISGRGGASWGRTLFAWLREFVRHVTSKRELALAIPDERGGRSELFDRWHKAMRSTASALLAWARESGDARSDVGASDLLALAGADDQQIGRLLLIVRLGTDARRPRGHGTR
jgi:hypothetical protein